MVSCDRCSEWFHGDCVGIPADEEPAIACYLCGKCKSQGPPANGGYPADMSKQRRGKYGVFCTSETVRFDEPLKKAQPGKKKKGKAAKGKAGTPRRFEFTVPAGAPKIIQVECNGKKAELRTETMEIKLPGKNGTVMRPTEFEKHAGSARKNWKKSIKIAGQDLTVEMYFASFTGSEEVEEAAPASAKKGLPPKTPTPAKKASSQKSQKSNERQPEPPPETETGRRTAKPTAKAEAGAAAKKAKDTSTKVTGFKRKMPPTATPESSRATKKMASAQKSSQKAGTPKRGADSTPSAKGARSAKKAKR